ncbi:MAG: iron ABC transporter permease [Anaerolineae bacterium]|nr:iron ABC transporter permease [Anaerolineae bacterium]
MRLTRNPYLLNSALLAVALLLSVAVGAVPVPPGALLEMFAVRLGAAAASGEWPQTLTTIVLNIRLPHTALMALAGAALAGSGAAYQGLFRNPLADPYLIGAASGAGLGAVLAMAVAWPAGLGRYAVPAAAFLGALGAVALVYALASSGAGMPTASLILAGVAVGSFATALSSYLMLRSQGELRRTLAWLLGGTTLGGWQPVGAMLPYIGVGLGVLLLSGHALNILQFGEEQAQQLGLRVKLAKTVIITAASLATAAAVAFAGVIGFVGLIVPHMARFVWGGDYRRVIPLSILGGASALLLADLLARRALAPQSLPVGVVTALVGAPFFLWLLRRVRGQTYW